MFLVKLLFSGYLRKVLVSSPAEMPEGRTDMLFTLQVFFISRANFPYSVIFCVSVFGMLWVKVTTGTVPSAVVAVVVILELF
jgi:hypothetical protein